MRFWLLIGILACTLPGNASAQLLVPAPIEATPELPDRFESMAEYKLWLNRTGRLGIFEQVLTFANGMEERRVDGTLNTRAFWWETMLLQPAQDILPNQTGKSRPDLTSRYRTYHRNETTQRTEVRELQMLADNRYASSGKLYLRFDAWYNAQVAPAVRALDARMTSEERSFLSNTQIPLGVYLVETVRLSQKYGIVSPTFSRASQDAALASLASPKPVQSPPEPRTVAKANVPTAATISRQEEQRKEQVVTQKQIATRSSILTIVLVIIGAIGLLLVIGYIQRIARRQM